MAWLTEPQLQMVIYLCAFIICCFRFSSLKQFPVREARRVLGVPVGGAALVVTGDQ